MSLSPPDEDDSGLQLLAKHLAKVKLEFAERDNFNETTIKHQQATIAGLEDALGAALHDVDTLKTQVSDLEKANSMKWRVKQLAEWKALVQNLRQDNQKLKEENQKLKQGPAAVDGEEKRQQDDPQRDIQYSQQPQSESLGEASMLSDPSASSSNKPLFQQLQDAKQQVERYKQELAWQKQNTEIALKNELQSLRLHLNEKDFEIEALKEKLNFELELKWERSHLGWKKSLMESFAEILAPFPSDGSAPPPSNTAAQRKTTATAVV